MPLDPSYPEARLAYMLGDAGLATVITQQSLEQKFPEDGIHKLCIDAPEIAACVQRYAGMDIPRLGIGLNSQHLAYVIYTSGSTGNPKGVMVTHRGAGNLVADIRRRYGLTRQDRLLQFATFSFDMSVEDIFSSLCSGSCLVLRSNAWMESVSAFWAHCEERGITVLNLPTAYWHELALDVSSAIPSCVRHLSIGGEQVNRAAIEAWRKKDGAAGVDLCNTYGPTECTVDASFAPIGEGDSGIGKAMSNTSLLVLDRYGQLCPIGVPGELHIGGAGIARGYLNRPSLTAERFIANPYHDANNRALSARLYKTGDLVRQRADGNIEFLGRIDHQVKLRGFRIELGEIEAALNTHARVKEALVTVYQPNQADKALAAYLLIDAGDPAWTAEGRQDLVRELRRHLGAMMPEYMIPAAFVLLEAWPLTPNGKINRHALPAPNLSESRETYIAPRNDTEQRLAGIWQEVLGLAQVGVTDNFFQLGGHSLSATRLLARINQAFDTAIPLKALFLNPSIDALAQAMQQYAKEPGRPALTRSPREGILLPSYAQQRLWLLDQIDGGSAHYNMPGAMRLEGPVDIDAANRAFGRIVERHETLRTRFAAGNDGQPMQIVMPAAPFVIDVTDLSQLAEGEQQLHINECMAHEISHVLDLAHDLLLRARLLRLDERTHVLVLNMHHIASDGWSISILVNEFCSLYQSYAHNQPERLPALPLQYVDYAQWQRRWLQGEVLEAQLRYWTEQLAGVPVLHSLPLDHARPKIQSFAGNTCYSRIPADLRDSLNAQCQAQGATLFMGLHTAFAVLLARYGNTDDIVVGSPIANREQAEIADLIGFFVNTLVLRSDLGGNPSFREALGRNQRMLMDAYAHQQVPFEQIVERLQPERSLSHSPLFQVMLALQNNVEGEVRLPELRLTPISQGSGIAKYDLLLNATEDSEGLRLEWEYASDLFDESTIVRMAGHFEHLLGSMLQQPELSVWEAELLDAAERSLILESWSATAADYPQERCVHELFEDQAKRQPEAVAVEFEGATLSYGELNERANRLAGYLIAERAAGPDTLIGLCMERSLDVIVAVLGILKAGAAYVPLDPSYPEARLAYMLSDAQLTTVIASQALQQQMQFPNAQVLCLDETGLQGRIAGHASDDIDRKRTGLQADHLAYVIYTSGSTGQPKGVLQTHRTLVNLVQAQAHSDGILAPLRSLQFAPLSFDVSAQELATAWYTGSTLVLISNAVKRDLARLPQELNTLAIERLFVPPAVLNWIAEYAHDNGTQFDRLKEIVVAGEALVQSNNLIALRQQHPGCRVFNHYGPTETHVATSCEVSDNRPAVSIGKPIPGLQAYVLDSTLRPAPIGVAGELYIGGRGLARGYLHRPELDAERYIDNPYYAPATVHASKRLYKTGDLVRWTADGNLDFVGRIDHQVKLRGFRIELGEIERRLAQYPTIRETLVLVRGEGQDKRLVAYVATEQADALLDTGEEARQARHELIGQLQVHLAQALPDYMVPAEYAVLEKLPLTPNGKVDRRALPEPEAIGGNDYVAPRTDTERALCLIWQDILNLPQVGIHDNFFRLGGHSLLATRAVTRINQHFTMSLPLQELFNAQTINTLAQLVDTRLMAGSLQLGGDDTLGANEEEFTL